MEIQPISIQDIENIQTIASQIWNKYYIKILSQEQIDYMLNLMYNSNQIKFEIENDFFWFKFLFNNNIIGFTSFSILNNNKYKLHKLYIDTNYHNKGFGFKAINFIIDFLKNKNATYLTLNVNKYNTQAINFYKKNGFQIIDSVVVDIGNNFVMDDYIMGRPI
jgi:ribosomal protein S18 acetylase RimI-like enzyme